MATAHAPCCLALPTSSRFKEDPVTLMSTGGSSVSAEAEPKKGGWLGGWFGGK
jgi:hypothetical protein